MCFSFWFTVLPGFFNRYDAVLPHHCYGCHISAKIPYKPRKCVLKSVRTWDEIMNNGFLHDVIRQAYSD